MAQIQYSALVSGIQGKLNGSVLSKGRTGQVIYKKPVQRKQPSQKQLTVRNAFSSAAAAWKTLTSTQQDNWATISANNPTTNKFGEAYTLPAYQYFKKMMALLDSSDQLAPIVPDLSDYPPYQFLISEGSLTWEPSAAGFVLSGDLPEIEIVSGSDQANVFSCYISLPVSDVTKPYFKTWYKLHSELMDPDYGTGTFLPWTISDVTMPEGWYTFAGALHVVKVVCFIPTVGNVSVAQIAPTTMTPYAPVVFPEIYLKNFSIFGRYYRNTSSDNTWLLEWGIDSGGDLLDQFYIVYQWSPQLSISNPPNQSLFSDPYQSDILVNIPLAWAQAVHSPPPLGAGEQYLLDYPSPNPSFPTRRICLQFWLKHKATGEEGAKSYQWCPITFA